jgi:hypothetical protein
VLEIDYTWTTDGASSGGLAGVQLRYGVIESVMTCQTSTLASTTSWSFQTAQESSGPWFTEASTSISTAVVSQTALRITGPYKWARPYLHSASTGSFQFRLVGVS